MAQTATLRTDERASGAPGIRGGEPHYQPQLDGVRGLAILAVLLSHASTIIGVFPTTGLGRIVLHLTVPCWGGVDLFFALSGFLITGILIRGRRGDHYFSSFYARRILRIFPIYYLFLIGSLAVCTAIPFIARSVHGSDAHLPSTLSQRLCYFLYLQNIPYFWPSLSAGLVGLWGAYWSLAVEEQFYFLWPTLVRFVRLRWLYWFCLAALVAAPFVRQWVAEKTGESLGLLQFPVSRLDGLFGGAALALYRELKGRPLPLGWGAFWGLLGFAFLIVIAIFHPAELTSPGFLFNRLGISAFALLGVGLITATQHPLLWLRPVLTSDPLLALGKYSYGIYVYHVAVFLLFERIGRHLAGAFSGPLGLLFAMMFCAIPILLSFGMARLSYELIEKRFLALKRYFPSPAMRV